MATACEEGLHTLPNFDSIPNFRILCKGSKAYSNATKLSTLPAIYRSSKPDRLISKEMDEFRKLGIKCIIDFRSEKEYMSSEGQKILDREYILHRVKIPKQNYKAGDTVQYDLVERRGFGLSSDQEMQANSESGRSSETETTPNHQSQNEIEKRHFLVNFFTTKYVLTLFSRLPWHLWCLGILHFLWDLITRNRMRTFTKFFVKKTLNTIGIFGQYVDFIELCQPSICSALKLLANPSNLPALLNCAHGKDRTGVVSALILTCLGMSKEYVAQEYAMSTEGLEPIKDLVYQDVVKKYHLEEEFCNAEVKNMMALLIYIEDRYKSVEDYMAHIGFSREEQFILKENLEAFDYATTPTVIARKKMVTLDRSIDDMVLESGKLGN